MSLNDGLFTLSRLCAHVDRVEDSGYSSADVDPWDVVQSGDNPLLPEEALSELATCGDRG